MRFISALLIILAFALPAHADDKALIAAAKRNIAPQLVDASGVRYRSLRVHKNADGRTAVCGQINSHNPYGGYAGWHDFFDDMGPKGGFMIIDPPSATSGGYPIWDKTWGKFWRAACVD